MANEKGNQTPNTPEVSETELRKMKVDDLREEAKDAGIGGVSGLKKEELVREVAKAGGAATAGGRPWWNGRL